jgi:hypothetical protein
MHTIFLDMDGPLANLHPLYFELTGNFDFNQDDFNRVVFEHKIFEIVKPTYEFRIFKEYIKKYKNVVNFGILGSLGTNGKNPERQKEILRQKNSWLTKQEIMYYDVPRHFVSNKKYKAKYANATSHLIDDTLVNVTDFIAAGGGANHHTPETWQSSFDYMDKVISETKNKHFHFIY